MNLIKQKQLMKFFLINNGLFFPECQKLNKEGGEKVAIGESWQTSTCQIPGLEGNITKMFVS